MYRLERSEDDDDDNDDWKNQPLFFWMIHTENPSPWKGCVGTKGKCYLKYIVNSHNILAD